MAKRISDEELRTSIVIDSNPAQQALIELEKNTRELKNENKDLIKEKNNLIKLGKKESVEYKNITQSITQNNKAVRENKERMKELQDQIGLTGLTLTQLEQTQRSVKAKFKGTIPGTEEYFRLKQELKEVNDRLFGLTGRAQEAGDSLENMTVGGKRFLTFLASMVALLTGAVVSFQKFIDINSTLSDAQADVMKTTGMTKKEVDELTRSFGLMKTRTARTELLKLSEEGGRLGITGVKNIQDYLDVANQLKVALGDDLNDTQIKEVGKMTEQYKVAAETGREFGGAMLSLGSAINEVSQAGSNEAGYLVDYLKRTSGVATQINLLAADNLGYAATFDEIGQNVEVTGTMMNKVWMDMSKNTGVYAKIAKMSVKDFSDMLNQDANAAMIKFLEGLKGSEEGFKSMVLKMDELDEGGARGAQALAALASNTDKLKDRQLTANIAMAEATSLTNEYAIKNNNLAANIEKIKNKIEEWMSTDTLASWLADIIEWIAKFIGASEDASGRMEEFRNKLIDTIKVITILIVSIASYRTALKLSSLTIKDFTLLKKVYNAVSEKEIAVNKFLNRTLLLLRAGYFKVTGETVKATAAMRLFNRTAAMNPLGLMLSVLMAAGAAFFLYRNRTEKATEAHKNLNTELEINNEHQKELSKSTADFKSKVDPLIRVLNDQTTSLNVRKKAYQELLKISPEFNQSVDDEFFATNKLNEVYGTLIKRLETLSIVKARGVVRDRRAQELANAEEQEYDAKLSADKEIAENEKIRERNAKRAEAYLEKIKNSTKEDNVLYDYRESESQSAQKEYKEAQKRKEEAQKALDSFTTYQTAKIQELQTKLATLKEGTEEYKLVEQELLAMIGVGTNSEINSTKTGTGTGTPDKKYEKEKQQRIEKLKEYKKERLALEREIEDSVLETWDEGFNKERQKLDTEYTRKLEDLQNKLVAEAEIEKALTASKNKALSKEERNFYADQARHWQNQNEYYQGLQLATEETFLLKKKALVSKYSKNTADELNKEFEAEKTAREIAYNEQLTTLGSNARKREELTKQYNKQEREEELKHLEELYNLYSDMLNGVEIEGIDFSLLTPEAEKKLKEDIAKVRLAYSELKAAQSGEKSEESELDIGMNAETDILGFTVDQWDVFFQNIERGTIGVQTMTMAVQSLQNMWNQYDQLVSAQENRRIRQYEKNTDFRQRGLKRQLDVGLIDQDQYNKASQVLEVDLDRKKAEIELKAAKRKRATDIANIITNTAMAIMSIWAQVPKMDFGVSAGLLSAMVGGLGAVQLATVMSQPMPGFEKGLYGDYVKREQDGKMFKAGFGGKTKSGVVTKPTYFLTGENGPEMIIDSKAFRQLNPELRDSLIRELRGIKGFENGFYNQDTNRIEIGSSNFSSDKTKGSDSPELLLILGRIEYLLDSLDKNGVTAIVSSRNIRNMKAIKEGIDKYNSIRDNSKI